MMENGSKWAGAGKLILAGAGVLGLVYFGVRVGENQRQIQQNRQDITTLQIVTGETGRTLNSNAVANAAIITKLDEILRRLDRLERKP